ncbi:MAG: hypothetical protein IPM08_06530 [Actinomycetales bacterium]|nr:hypothetical protein [Actinomycetales bacterium]
MTTPVRVDLLGSDDEMLSLVGMRAFTGDDAVGALLAAVASAVDRPIQPVMTGRRRRRRIGFGVFATAAFLASGSGMAAAVSDSLPSVADSIVALRSDRGAAPGAPAVGADVQGQQGLESFARLGNPLGVVTVVDLISDSATTPWPATTPLAAFAGDSSGMPSTAGVLAGSPTAVESLRLPSTDPTLADQGAGSGSGGSAVIAGGGGANPATGGSGSGAASAAAGTMGAGTVNSAANGNSPGTVSGAGTVNSAANGTAGPGNTGTGNAAANAGGNGNASAGNGNANAGNGNANSGNANSGNGNANAGGGNTPAAAGAAGTANRATAAPSATPSAPVGATGRGGSPR